MKPVALFLSLLLVAACNKKPEVQNAKLYPFSGKIVSINLKDRTAMIDGSAIPNYMDAMKMDYPIASETDLGSLRVGEEIKATVKVSEDGSYILTDIHDAGK